MSRGHPPVAGKIIPSGEPVKIQEPVLASGVVDVRVTDDTKPIHGVVESYRDLLPDVGESVRASVNSGVTLSTAKPDRGSYIVYLSESSNYEGYATVRITEIDDRISGEIVETIEPGQTASTSTGDSPHTGQSPPWNITRKKL